MRQLVITNSIGESITLGYDTFGITSLTGIGCPEVINQEQRAPFQDGSTNIDQLFEPREIEVVGTITTGNLAEIAAHRRTLTRVLNPKLGELNIVYTNDAGSKMIVGVSNGPEFKNKNANDGSQEFMIVFYCNDPYWLDVSETVATVESNNALLVINNTGDVDMPFEATITGTGDGFTLTEQVSEDYIEYDATVDSGITVNTGFGKKSVVLDTPNEWVTRMFGDINAVASDGNNVLCAVGSGGLVMISVDGIDWTIKPNAITYDFLAVVFNPARKLWIAVGEGGVIYTSSDYCETWTERVAYSNEFNDLRAVAYDSVLGRVVTVGGFGRAFESSDCITWASLSGFSTPKYLTNVGVFGAVTIITGNDLLATTSDGSTWNITAPGYFLYGVTKNTDTNVYYVSATHGNYLSSSNLTSWTALNTGYATATRMKIYYFQTVQKLVIIHGGAYYYSSNGTSWTLVNATERIPYDLVYFASQSKIISIGVTTYGGFTDYSTNATSWTTANFSYGIGMSGVFIINGVYYALGQDYYLRSTNGEIYTRIALSSTGILQSMAMDASGKIIMVAASGNIYSSSNNGVTFSLVETIAAEFNSVTYSDSLELWCACSADGEIYTSPSGLAGTWTSQTTGTTKYLTEVKWIASYGMFIACGGDAADGRIIIKSTNGTTWVESDEGPAAGGVHGYNSFDINERTGAILFAGNVVTDAIITRTYDMITFELIDITQSSVFGLFHDKNRELFIAFDSTNMLESNDDGETWINKNGVSSSGYVAFDEENNKYVFITTSDIFTKSTSGGASVIQYVTPASQFFQLQRGRNLLKLTTDAGYVSAEVRYRKRYVGV